MVVAGFIETQLIRDDLEQMPGVLKIGADLEQEPIRPRVDAAAAQVGDAAVLVGRQRARSEGDANPGRGFAVRQVQNMRRNRRELAQRPTRSSGLTGARRNSRPVALRSAATTAGGTTTVDGSPTPFAPYRSPGTGSSTSSEVTGGMASVVGMK